MDVSDISGAKAKPSRRFSEIRNSQKLGNVGAQIMNSHRMESAGRMKVPLNIGNVSDLLMGGNYEHVNHNVNGVKKNQYGQVMKMDERLVNEVAGQVKSRAQGEMMP